MYLPVNDAGVSRRSVHHVLHVHGARLLSGAARYLHRAGDCYREGERIPWESGITVVTPLNRNRWNLNIEGTLSFQKQHGTQMRIFISEHQWKGGQPTEEALMIMGYGDDSSVPIPAIFMFVPGMPILANRNTYAGLNLVNGSTYTALDTIVDKAYPGHEISANTTLHFGPPAGLILAAESTKTFNFVGMPPGTVLLTPCKLRQCEHILQSDSAKG